MNDAWDYDHYLARQISEVLEHLAEHGMTYPGPGSIAGQFDTHEKWAAYLRSIASALRRYVEAEDCEQCWGSPYLPDEHTCHLNCYEEAKEAMHKLADVFGHLWD
jgi:hypothetical protein